MNDKEKFRIDFMKEQYGRLHEVRRQHNGFIWQIPSVVAGAILLFIGLSRDKIHVWITYPYIPCIGFLILSMFTFVMYVFHRRNVKFLKNFETVISNIEKEIGIYQAVYAGHADTGWDWYDRIRSSTCLGLFLLFVFILNFCGFIFYLCKWTNN